MSTRHVCTKVTLRQRAIRNEKISLYLDYYPAIRNPETMTMSRRSIWASTSTLIPRTNWSETSTLKCLTKQKQSDVFG